MYPLQYIYVAQLPRIIITPHENEKKITATLSDGHSLIFILISILLLKSSWAKSSELKA